MRILALLLPLCGLLATGASAADQWVEGTHYTRMDLPTRPSDAPGHPVVTEVFSYACPACNAFVPTMKKLRDSLPRGAEVVYVPAGFIPAEDWPMFQRAYCTAQVLGIADKAHDAMFRAVWDTGELATMNPDQRGLKSSMPTIEDAARFYNRVTGVKVDEFVAASKSFSVDMKIKAADDFIVKYRVSSTPTIIVDGRYTTNVSTAGGYDQLVALVDWLVAKDYPAKTGSGSGK